MRYDLLIADLDAYVFGQEALRLIQSYLCDRSQNVKMGSSFSNELDNLCGFPKRSILGPLLFNIATCDLTIINISSDIANYVDGITPYECAPFYYKLKIGIVNLQNI